MTRDWTNMLSKMSLFVRPKSPFCPKFLPATERYWICKQTNMNWLPNLCKEMQHFYIKVDLFHSHYLLGLLHRYAGDKRTVLGGNQEAAAKMGVTSGHQASHGFWGRQNCSPPWVPITHAVPLAVSVSHLSGRCHLCSAHDGLFDIRPFQYTSIVDQWCFPSSSVHLLLFCERKLLHFTSQ